MPTTRETHHSGKILPFFSSGDSESESPFFGGWGRLVVPVSVPSFWIFSFDWHEGMFEKLQLSVVRDDFTGEIWSGIDAAAN